MRVVDDNECARLHREEKLSVAVIAARFHVQRAAIYRAFRRAGYAPHGLYMLRGENLKKAQPLAPKLPRPANERGTSGGPHLRDAEAERRAIEARRIAPRDPCPRCGIRRDIGCRHNQTTLGWSVG